MTYCANTHRAIRDSLIRLNAAHLRIRVKRVYIPMPRLLDVLFDDGYEGASTPERLLKGSDLVSLRSGVHGQAFWAGGLERGQPRRCTNTQAYRRGWPATTLRMRSRTR